MCSRTHRVSVGGVLVLLPGYQAVPVEVLSLKLPIHLFDHPSPLSILDPRCHLFRRHKAVLVVIYTANQHAVHKKREEQIE